MTFAPNPKQALFLWKMINAETPEIREPTLMSASPKLGKDRKPLVDQGFIEIEKRGGSTHLILTDRAWAWANQCAHVELTQANAHDGAIALQGLLRRLVPFLQSRGIPLAELFSTSFGNLATPEGSQASVKRGGRKKSPTRRGKPVKKRQPVKKNVPIKKARPAKKSPSSTKSPIAKKVRPGSRMLTKKGRSAEPKRAVQKKSTRQAAKTRRGSTDVELLSDRIRELCRALCAGRPTQEIRLTALRAQLPKVSRIELDGELLRMHQAGQVALYRDDNSVEVTAEDERDALLIGDAPRHILYLKG